MALMTTALRAHVLALDLAAAGVDVADDEAGIFSGVTTSTFMIGSSRTEPPFCSASRVAARVAISKARTDESTSWKAPSMSVALRSTTGKPARTPSPTTDSMPFSTPGMYSFGTAPPTIWLSN